MHTRRRSATTSKLTGPQVPNNYPQRIVTLLPSATEIVCGLGLIDRLVGVTHECDFPAGVCRLPHVTASAIPKDLASGEIDLIVRDQLSSQSSLYTLDAELLAELEPDLIVTQALCDVCAVSEVEVHRVARHLDSHPAVINLEPVSLSDVFDTIHLVGDATGIADAAHRYVSSLRARVDTVCEGAKHLPLRRRPRVALLEWIDPPFNAGHWNPELIDMAGGIDCLGNIHEPSHTITFNEIEAANPDILVVALCGFDAARAKQDLKILEANLPWQRLRCVLTNQVHVLDGNAYFSRSGPRLVDSLEILASIVRGASQDTLQPRVAQSREL